MGKEVEEKVLEMRFDNRDFEKNVSTTLGSIDKLKQGLKFEKSAEGLANIGKGIKDLSFDGLYKGVETVSSKFSALEVVGITALANITNSAINASKRLISEFTIEPISTGFSEFELKMGSVQTIMASTGESLDNVNKYLEELNKYSDQTIYSFSDMTNNIGKFTNAGVKLEDAVAAIKGISNEAALSGANADEASRAMYNFSQALSAGYVKLIDWKSIENANMATKGFKEELIKTAVELGTVEKTADGMYKVLGTNANGASMKDTMNATKNFNDSLSYQWMTTDVLTQTLAKYADANTDIGKKAYAAAQDVKTFSMMMDTLKEAAQSGWAQTWETIVGNFDQGKELWTEMANYFGGIIEQSSSARNELLKGWAEGGGRESAINAFFNSFKALHQQISLVKLAFHDVFPKTTAENLITISKKVEEFTSHLYLGGKEAKQFRAIFRGIFATLDIGVELIKQLGQGVFDIMGEFSGLGSSLLESGAGFGDYMSNLRDSVKSTNVFHDAIQNVVSVVKSGIKKIRDFKNEIHETMDQKQYSGFFGFVKGLWKLVTSIGSAIVTAMGSMGKSISDLFNKGDILEVVNTVLTTGILVAVKKFVDKIGDVVGNAGDMLENITGILEGVKGCLEEYQSNLKASRLMKIAIAVGVLTAALYVLSGIDGDSMIKGLAGMAAIFGEMLAALAMFEKLGDNKLKGVGKSVTIMIAMSASMAILASALKKLSDIQPEALARGLVAIGVTMAEIGVFLKTYSFDKKLASSATGILILSAALVVMAQAVKNFGSLDNGVLGKGLAAVGGMLAEITLFMRVAGKSQNVLKLGVSMIALAGALKIMASALKDFGSMKLEEIGRGLLAMGGALAEVTIALKLMPKNTPALGAGLVIVASSLLIMGKALSNMSTMSWEEIGKGLVTLGGSLVILAGALHLMNGTAGGSASLLLAASALAVITPILKVLGNMSVEEIAKSLITLAGTFGIIGGAAMLLSGAIPAILAFSAAILGIGLAVTAVGAGVAMIGIGLAAIGAGITSIAAAGTAGAVAFVAAVTVIVTGLLDLVPTIIGKFDEIIVALCDVIGESAPALAEAALQLLSAVTASIAQHAPEIIGNVVVMIIGVINALADHIPEFIVAVVDFIGKLFDGIIQVLNGIDTTNLIKAITAIGLLAAMTAALAAVASMVPMAMVGALGVGAVVAELALIFAAIGALNQIQGLEELVGSGGNLLQAVGTAIGQFVGGVIGGVGKGVTASLPEMGTNLTNFMTNISGFVEMASKIDPASMAGVATLAGAILAITATDVVTGITSFFTGGNSLENFAKDITTLGEGLKNYADVVDGINVSAVTSAALATKYICEAANMIPNSGGVAGFFAGENDISDFAPGMKDFGKGIADFSNEVANVNGAQVVVASKAGVEIMKAAAEIPNSGGVAAFFAGDNNIEDFAPSLKTFGEGIANFSNAVTGVKVVDVTNAANAGKALFASIGEIPNSGGLASMFTGDNDISAFAPKLKPFGEGIAEFAKAVCGVKVSNVSGAISVTKSLCEIADMIPNSGGVAGFFAGENDFSTFASSMSDLGDGISTFYSKVNNIRSCAIQSIAKQLLELINAIVKVNSVNVKDLQKNMKSLADKGISSFTVQLKNDTTANSALTSWADAVLKSLNSYQVKFTLAGLNMTKGFINGIKIKVQNGSVYAAGYSLGNTAYVAAKKALDEHSPSKKMKKVGEFAVEGFVMGLSEKKNTVTKISTNMMTEFVKVARDTVGKTSVAQGAIKKFAKSFTKYGNTSKKAMASATKAVSVYVRKLYETSSYYKEDLANLKADNKELSKLYKQKNKLYSDLNKAKNKKTAKSIKDQVKDINKEITKQKKQILKDAETVEKNMQKVLKEMRNSIKDTVKSYVSLFSMSNDSGIDIFSKYDDGTEERASKIKSATDNLTESKTSLEEANKNLTEAETELALAQAKSNAVNGRSQKFLDQIKEKEEAVAEAKKAVTEATEAQTKAQEALDAANADADVKDLLDNMQSQVDGWTNWQKNLATVKKSLGKSGAALYQYLEGLGINGADTVATFVKMSNEELKKAKNLWGESAKASAETLLTNWKNKLTEATTWGKNLKELQTKFKKMGISAKVTKALTDELVEQGPESGDLLMQILGMSKSELKDFESIYKDYMKVPGKVADNVVAAETQAYKNTLSKEDYKKAGEKAGEDAIKGITSGIKNNSDKAKKQGKKTSKSVLEAFKEYLNATKGEKVSANVLAGMIKGMSNKQQTGALEAVCKALGEKMLKSTKKALGIKSPSREFAKIGKFTVQGLSKGIEDNDQQVQESFEELSKTAISSMSDALSVLGRTDLDFDTTPTIRPVLDLSEIETGVSDLNSMLTQKHLNVGAVATFASDLSRRTLGNIVIQNDGEGGSSTTNNETNDTYNFYITSTDPKGAADEISRILGKKKGRKDAVWDHS